LSRLQDFAEASKDWVRPGVHTPRWNPRPGALELSAVRAAVGLAHLDGQPAALKDAAEHCVATVGPVFDRPGASLEVSAMTDEAWREACGFDDAITATAVGDKARQLLRGLQEFAYARKIRRSLGLVEEDKVLISRPDTHCPPL
jgi:hypothetical protein